MTFYRFKTFKSTYYFPPLTPDSRFIYSLYGNYGGRIAHLWWWLFCHISLVRRPFAVKESEIREIALLRSLLGEDALFGVNMGTIGPDQKISVLGYHSAKCRCNAEKSRFFAKLAVSERAKVLSRNEIKVYQLWKDSGLVPALYTYQDAGDYVFLKCECLSGEHVPMTVDPGKVIPMLKMLKCKHYPEDNATDIDSEGADGRSLKTCFAHMDFCPWNMLLVGDMIRLIDWEMAAEQPLGFDLFTFLLQPAFLLDDSCGGIAVIEKHRAWIDDYFEGEDWLVYLKAFIDYKVAFFAADQRSRLYVRYLKMQHSMQ